MHASAGIPFRPCRRSRLRLPVFVCMYITHPCSSGQINSSRLRLPFITAIGEEASQGAEEKERQRRRAEHRSVLHEENSSLLGGLFFVFCYATNGHAQCSHHTSRTYIRESSFSSCCANGIPLRRATKISRNGQNNWRRPRSEKRAPCRKC